MGLVKVVVNKLISLNKMEQEDWFHKYLKVKSERDTLRMIIVMFFTIGTLIGFLSFLKSSYLLLDINGKIGFFFGVFGVGVVLFKLWQWGMSSED